jgi:vacuolar protein sorting-associated protein 13A/C
MTPKSKEDWEIIDTYETSQELKEQLLSHLALTLFQELTRTFESEQQKRGFFKNMGAKILDNLQFTIKNVHIRFENCGDKALASGKKNPLGDNFCIGMTLKEISAHTTDEGWGKTFVDRTLEENT